MNWDIFMEKCNTEFKCETPYSPKELQELIAKIRQESLSNRFVTRKDNHG